jgi:putative transposase
VGALIGHLLAAPPTKGLLRCELDKLAAREWRHPVTGEPIRFGVSTLERWYYRARKERHDPVGVLRRKLRNDAGRQAAMGAALREAVLAQYPAHRSWSATLHYDNLVALAEHPTGRTKAGQQASTGSASDRPSQHHGPNNTPGRSEAEPR